MPRQARLDTPGALHHIMVRGLNRSDIFDDEERSRFLTRLGQNILETQFSLYAWVPMETHIYWCEVGNRGFPPSCEGSSPCLGTACLGTGHLSEDKYL